LDKKIQWLTLLTFIAAILAWGVFGLGAFTRLTDAGLGCPDWPSCYGHWSIPSTSEAIQQAMLKFPNSPFTTHKALTEMIHRYGAGALGLFVIAIAILCIFSTNKHRISYLVIAILLLVLLAYQAVLGMWTVTLQLMPIIVTSHLLVGMILLSLLWIAHLKARYEKYPIQINKKYNKSKFWVTLGLFLVFLQIALGAWTSTNHAALSCTSFPFCFSQGSASYDFRHAFNILTPMNNAARRSIQMMHRFSAFIVMLYSIVLTLFFYIKKQYKLATIMVVTLILLFLQVATGIMNVLLLLPLPIAITHNLIAALILMCMVTLNFYAFSKRKLSAEQEKKSHEIFEKT